MSNINAKNKEALLPAMGLALLSPKYGLYSFIFSAKMKKLNTLILGLLLSMSPPLQAHPSWGIAVNSQGELYVADILHGGLGCIWRISPSGQPSMLIKDFHCHALQEAPDGYIYAAGSWEDKGIEWQAVVQIAPGGKWNELFRVKKWEEFFAGSFGVDAKGNFYFAFNKKVWQRSPDGQLRSCSDHRFNWINNLIASPEGEIYVVDKDDKGGTLYCIGQDGEAEPIAYKVMASASDTLHCPDNHDRRILGMELDTQSNIYLASNCGRQIIKVKPDGKQSIYYSSEGSWYPLGLAIQNETAYIIELSQKKGFYGPRILQWRKGEPLIQLALFGTSK